MQENHVNRRSLIQEQVIREKNDWNFTNMRGVDTVLDIKSERLVFILRGKNRRDIYRVLLKRPLTMKAIKMSTGIQLSNVSRIIREFEKHGLAVNITPLKRTGCLYRLTREAVEIRVDIEKHLEFHETG